MARTKALETLTAEQTRKLERLALYGTKWEIALCHNGAESHLVQYAGGKSWMALFGCIRKVGEDIVRLTGAEEFTRGDKLTDGVTLGDGWTIKYTGRTQREAIMQGELPFVCDVRPMTLGDSLDTNIAEALAPYFSAD